MASSRLSRFSSWIRDDTVPWMYKICLNVLKRGSIPQHVAVVMDGNRRYAQKENIEKKEGHQMGFEKLREIMLWCSHLGIREITVYAFSIENFKRSKEEVDVLMDMAREKFRTLINEWEKFRDSGVCIRIIGNLTYLPRDVITLMIISMLLTKDNNRSYLNIACSYTAKEELINTSRHLVHGIRQGNIEDVDVTEEFLSRCLYTYQSPDPDIIIRTSGEIRLSDFLTWQGSNSYLHFDDVLWPEFSAWNFISAIFFYQHFVCRKSPRTFSENTFSGGSEKEEFPITIQAKRLRLLIDACGNESVVDIKKLFSFKSPDELYHYYKTTISEKI